MTIQKVALLGANGNVGGPLLTALVSANFTVTVLQRASSKSQPAHQSSITIRTVPDDLPLDALISALRDHDAAITAIPLTSLEQHLTIASAAAQAGVKHYIPADFGSVDASASVSQELVPLFVRKTRVREHLDQLVGTHAGFHWTSLVNGHFFDWGLRENFLHFDVAERKALILGDGEQRSSLSTLGRVAEATVGVLRLAGEGREEVRDKTLFVQSFCITQWELLRAVEGATGAKWEVERRGLEDFVEEKKRERDAGSKQAIEDLVFALGIMDGDWTKREEFSMGLLGLEDEDLQRVVDGVVKEVDGN
ncbi:Hypothetical protein D9617_7g029650 [Elsinoe fawcettii]|nr:Hypothetical protein D9617_7g029650 [Elsinoe fawcettii]